MTIAQLVGDNVRRRRKDAGISLDKLASLSPLPMSTGRVGDIEAGRASITINVLLAMAAALSRATAEPVTLADLLDGEGDVALGDQFTVELSTLRAALRGEPVPIFDAGTEGRLGEVMHDAQRMAITRTDEWKRLPQSVRRNLDPHQWLRVWMTMRETDLRMCKSIGVKPSLGAAVMTKLWGQPFSDYRDHRAGPDANAQRKGQISRQLKAQLEEAIP